MEVNRTTTPVRLIQYTLVWLLVIAVISAIGLHIRTTIQKNHTALTRTTIAKEFHLTILNQVTNDEKALTTITTTQSVINGMKNQLPDTTIVHPILETTRRFLDASIVYIMDTSGQVVASTQYEDTKSLYGNRYPFRPYFKRAMEGEGILYPALGVTTNEKGLYHSEPIYDTDSTILGVVIIKSSVEKLQRIIKAQTDPAMMVSPEGVVFCTNLPEYEFTLVRPATSQMIQQIETSRQFGHKKIAYSTLDIAKTSGIIDDRSYTLFAREITSDGWAIILCQDNENLLPLSDYEEKTLRLGYILLIILITLLMLLHGNMRLRFFAQREAQAIFNSTLQGMLILSTDGTILKMNETAAAFRKNRHDLYTGNHFTAIPWWENSSISTSHLTFMVEKAATGETVQFEATLIGQRDKKHHFDFSIKPFYDKNMHLSMLIVEARDITPIKNISNELDETKQSLQALINSMPSVIVAIDKDKQVTRWNKEAERGTKIFLKDALGKELREVLPQLYNRIGDLEQLLEQTGVSKREKVRIPFNGDERITQVTLYRSETPHNAEVVIRIDDTTEETLLEERMQQSQKMDAVGQLAGGIAHDFNNLLTGILGALDLFRMDDMERPFLIDIITSAVKSGSELTHKLLNFSRIENITIKPVSVHESIKDAVAILHASLDNRITISHDLQAEVETVQGSIGELENIFINLGINASHAMNEQGEIQITTENREISVNQGQQFPQQLEAGRYIRIEVKDNGSGIPDEHINQVFEPFYTTKGEGKGTGLGLATVLSIVKKMHGTILIDSEIGMGTTFTIYLPLATAQSEENHHELNTLQAPSQGTLLLIEDDTLVRFTTGELLRSLGYKLILADDFAMALRSFRAKHKEIDLVIMPDYRAQEGVPLFVLEETSIPLLITTENLHSLDTENLTELGVNGFVEKPFSLKTLQSAIDKILSSSTEPLIQE